MKASVIVFPGSNCDRDIKISLEKFGIKTSMIWHADAKLPKSDLVVLPGVLEIPIAHNEGNYFANKDLINELEDNNQIVLQYCDSAGNITEQCNPNGSIKNIAGIINKKGNVFGLMPHPERASDKLLGGMDGSIIFKSLK